MPAERQAVVKSTVRYLRESAVPSLLRNGQCGTKRALNGNDNETFGDEGDYREITIHNARMFEKQPMLSKEGFQLGNFALAIAKNPDRIAENVDYLDHVDVVKRYYPQVEAFVKECSGAKEVYCFDHNIRKTTIPYCDKEPDEKGNEKSEQKNTPIQVQAPIGIIHTDYTVSSAPRRLCDLIQPPKANDSYAHSLEPGQSLIPPERLATPREAGEFPSRFVMFNVWKSIDQKGEIQQKPLAICGADSMSVEEDMAVFEIHYADRVGENWFSKYSDKHKWYYYPDMTFDEALIFKQWDSSGAVARRSVRKVREVVDGKSEIKVDDPKHLESLTFLMGKLKRFDGQSPDLEKIGGELSSDFCVHCAFDDPSDNKNDDLRPRESIEVRCFAFF